MFRLFHCWLSLQDESMFICSLSHAFAAPVTSYLVNYGI